MTDHSTIEWTDRTWNPVTGCTKVSAGCDHCYAETIAERFSGGPAFPNGFDVQLREHKLTEPLRWRKPSKVFVNSMSDLFHDDIPTEYIAKVFAVMAMAPQHTFQVLTKRHARMRSVLASDSFPELVTTWAWRIDPGAAIRLPSGGGHYSPSAVAWALPNVWLGVSAEDQQWANIRIPTLLKTPAAVRFISAEPLLGPIKLGAFVDESLARRYGVHDSLCDGPNGGCFTPWCRCSCHHREYPTLDWVIVGGESGHGARPMHPQWARDIRDQCARTGVPFLFKQWGEWTPNADGHRYRDWANLDSPHAFVMRVGKGKAGRELDGRTWDQFPAVDR